MEQRRFGPTNSQVAVIGQGTWYSKSDDLASALATLRRGLDLGMTHIDTAEMYLGGAAEEMVAKAIVGRREEIFLVSKVLPEHASRYGTITTCEGSLARLNTDRLDCYLLHWRGPYPLEDTIAAFEQLHSEGKILSWGVSNFDVPDLEEAWEIAGEGRSSAIRCSTICRNGRSSTPCSPGARSMASPWSATARSGTATFPGPRTPVVACCRDRRGAQCHAAPGRTPVPGAAPFALHDPRATRPDHAAENAGAGDLQLSAAELARIDAAFPRGPRPYALPVL